MDLLDSLPDVATQERRERERMAQRLGLTTQYTEEQRAAQAQAFQDAQRRSNAAHTTALVQARETEFRNVTTNQNRRTNHPQMEPHPPHLRLVPGSDPAGGRKKRRRRAAARRTAPSAPQANNQQRFPSVPAHRTPDQIAQDNATGVRTWHVENARDGTYTAYEPKKQEWDEFCTAVYGPPAMLNANVASITELPPQIRMQLYTVAPLKCYSFVFYQAHRKQRSRRPANSVQFGPAELTEYHEINRVYGGAQSNPPDPENCLGFSQVNIYRAVVYNVWHEQKSSGCNGYSWENDINTDELKMLMKKVKNRAPLVSKRNAEEKIDGHMAPFFYVQWLPHLEKYFFAKGASNHHSAVFSSLRNSFTFKFSLAGVLRGESLERADLSDLCDYSWKGQVDPYPIHILIMAICQGKTNLDKKLFGRAMRHRTVEMCPIGALALYLWYRFDVRGEWSDARPDFIDNKAWFFIKLLVSSTSDEVIEELDIKTYSDALQAAMDAVGVACNHRAHFGRKVMPIILEMLEVQSDLVKNLGLWCRDVHEEHYSASMPLQAMRVAAGHRIEAGSVFYKRGQKPVTAAAERLRKLIFPWLDAEMERVRLFNSNGPRQNSKPTAAGFLLMLDNLRDVLLQDIACRMNDPESPAHQVFRHTIFQSDDFQLYRQEMEQHMSTFADPMQTALQQDHPGLNARFDALQNQMGDHQSLLHTLQTQVAAMPQKLTTCLLQAVATGASGFASSLAAQSTPDHGTVRANETAIRTQVEGGVRHLAMPPGTAPELCIEGAAMARQFQSVTQMYQQFYGTGEYEGKPVEGGFAKLEETGTTWRTGYNNSQLQHFSKLKRIINAVDEKINTGMQCASVLAEFDALWTVEDVNMNTTKMITKLQAIGLVKRNTRKRKSADSTAREQRRRDHQAASASVPIRNRVSLQPTRTAVI